MGDGLGDSKVLRMCWLSASNAVPASNAGLLALAASSTVPASNAGLMAILGLWVEAASSAPTSWGLQG